LPALPSGWKNGSITGLKARGGFEVDMQWQNGELTSATIKSSLGGSCRIRSYFPLKGKGLTEAKGQNPNTFYSVTEIKTPLVHAEKELAPLNLRKIYEYDFSTKKGEVLELQKL